MTTDSRRVAVLGAGSWGTALAKSLSEILAGMSQVAEGVRTTKSAHELSNKRGVEMPIVHAMYRILYEDLPPLEAGVGLMSRKAREERD